MANGIMQLLETIDLIKNSAEMYALIERLFPICRSITGEGVRETLRILQESIPLEIKEVPTGTQVYDWQVPKEWNIRDAYIKNSKGEKVVDFQNSNLHIMSYSVPVNKKLSLQELLPHLYSLPEQPDWIPNKTSYYNENWGFCLSHNDLESLQEDEYDVVIDSSLNDGSLTYGELLIPGKLEHEVVLYAHCCHPSLCNDNLTGIALITCLAKLFSQCELRYSYRFVFAPALIGSLTWLSQNEGLHEKIMCGVVAALLGDDGHLHYKKSEAGDSLIDRAVLHVLQRSGKKFDVIEFSPYGYDERQFCSPGINLAMGRLTRTPNGCYPEYHTSADNLDIVKPEYLADSLETYLEALNVVDNDEVYQNLSPKGEPQLGRRGLYRKTGGLSKVEDRQLALLWVLNQSNGKNSLLEIAERAQLKFSSILGAANALSKVGLLEKNIE